MVRLVVALLCGCGRVAFEPIDRVPGDGMGAEAGPLDDATGDADATIDAPPPAGFAFVRGGSEIGSDVATLDAPIVGTQVATNLNVVIIGTSDNSNVTGVTDDRGTTYVIAIGPTAGAVGRQWMYVGVIDSSGTNTIHVQFDRLAVLPGVMVAEYSGVDTTNPVITTSSDEGISMTSSAGTLTVPIAPALIVAGNTNAQPSTLGPGAGYVERVRSGYEDILEDRVIDTPGAYVADAALTTSHVWIMQAIALRPAN